MKWFSLKGIRQEITKVRWPKRNELAKDTYVVLVFMTVFAVYFIFADLFVGFLLRLLGVIV